MSDYTPRVEQLKEAFLINQVSAAEVRGMYTGQTGFDAEAEFDRAIAKIKADVWDEAASCAPEYMPANPYRIT